MYLELKGQKIEEYSRGTTMCNVHPEWCEEGKKEEERNWGEGGGGGIYIFSSEGRN